MKRNGSIACMLLVLGAAGCSGEEAEDRTSMLMGATFSTTGVSAVSTWGNAFDLAALDASEGLKQAGFPTGKHLKFDTAIMDTSNKVDITVAGATKMVKEQGAKMVINGTSADTVALGKLEYDTDTSNDLAVPVVCVACSSPALHNPTATNADPAVQGADRNEQKWIFGLAMSSVPQSQVLWNILVDSTPAGNIPGDLNGDGVVKISTIALDDAFGTGFQGAMKKVVDAATDMGITNGTVKYEETRHPKDADLSAYDWAGALALLTDNKTGDTEDKVPDAVIEFTFPQFSLALVKAYTGSVPFFHTHSMRESTVVLAAENTLEGQDGTSYLPSDGRSGELFDARFTDVFRRARQSQWDSDVYDGGFLFGLAAVKATMDMDDPSAVTGAQIRDAMLTLNNRDGEPIQVGPDEFAKAAKLIAEGKEINYEGASGPCDFDDYGRATNRISHWRVEGGQAKDLAVYDCVSDSATCPKMP